MVPDLSPLYDRVDAKRRRLFNQRPLPAERIAVVKHAQDLAWLHDCHLWGGGTMRQADIETIVTTGMAVAGHPVIEHVEIGNLADALDWMEGWAKANGPLRLRDIQHLHALLNTGLSGATPGRFRTRELRIDGLATGHIPGTDIPRRMQWLCSMVNRRERRHAIERAVGACASLLAARPFGEGNDLVARLLLNGLLLQRAYPIAVLDDHDRLHDAQQAAAAGEVRPLGELVAAAVEHGLDRYLAALS
jgi:Fic family protein